MHHKATGKKFEFARMLRKECTEDEDKLWQKLRARRLGVKFRRQHPIDAFVVDFFCHEKGLIIEVDGGIHLNSVVKERDINREKILNSFGYSVLRFKNEEIEDNISEVLEKIGEAIRNQNG